MPAAVARLAGVRAKIRVVPEAAEVERMRRQLSVAEGTRLRQIVRVDTDLFSGLDDLRDVAVTGTRRLGKRIAVDLTGGTSLVIHPRITGRLEPAPWPADLPHIRAMLEFEAVRFAFTDRRRLGGIDLIPSAQFPDGYGIDLLDASESDLRTASTASNQRRRAVKALMLDQSGPVCGAGNYLVDETLFALRIHPLTNARDLTAERWVRVWMHCRGLAQRSLEGRPALLSDYIAPFDATGEQGNALACYGRAGQPCVFCRTDLVKLRVADRGTTICPSCQPLRAVAQVPMV